MVLERGALLNNRYRIIEILGQGGMGSVYRAIDQNLGVEVAVKDNFFTTDEYARQFKREAIILANLRHPNLPRVTDHFVIAGQGQYLVMDFIEGEDLHQRMDRLGPLPEEDVITIGAAICDALTYLGSRNPPVVHRDIKPGNVKITPSGQIFLVDFGLAKTIQGPQVTSTGARAMTPGYSPPEQYGTARTDQRSDIYSLGATLYAALTCRIPEDALNRAMNQSDLTALRKHNPRVSRRLASVIEKALTIRPEERYADAEEFKRNLLGIQNLNRKTGEYKVTPPPDLPDKPLAGDHALLPNAIAQELPRTNGRSPQLLARSETLDEPGQADNKAKRARSGYQNNCLLRLILVLAVVIGVGGTAIAFRPAIAKQVLNLLRIPAATPTATLASLTEIPFTVTYTATATLTQFPTFTPSPTSTLEPTATSSPTIPNTPTNTPTITLTPSPVPTLFAGAGGQIAFASSHGRVPQIYTMDLRSDGSGEPASIKKLTNIETGACQPRWSPDGKQLAFISPCPGQQEWYPGSSIYIIDAAGTNQTLFTNVPGGDYDPAWSPDGSELAFTSVRGSGRPQIYIYNFASKEIRKISETYSRDQQPAWSPDGKKIVYATEYPAGTYQLWIMDPDGKNKILLTKNTANVNLHPSWSPDGQYILYTESVSVSGMPRLAVALIKDKGMTIYHFQTSPLIPMQEGRYSPDGTWIIFEGWPAGYYHDIWAILASGAERQQVTNDLQTDFDPDWKPVP